MYKNLFILLICLLLPSVYLISQEPDIKYKKYFNFIVVNLDSPDISNKADTIRLLSQLNDKSILPKLKKLLAEQSDIVRIEAARSLYKLGDKTAIKTLESIVLAKVDITSDDKPAARAKKMAKNLMRAKAASVLGELGDKSSMPALKKSVQDTNGQVKDASLISLVKLGDNTGINFFLKGLRRDDISIIKQSCQVLGELREQKSKEKLQELVYHWDKGVKASACLALGKIGDNKDGILISRLLKDEDVMVRLSAVESLGFLGDSSFIPDIKEKLEDKNGLVRLSAVESLLKLKDNSGDAFLISSISSPDSDAAIKAISILQQYGKKNAIEPLEKAFETDTPQIVKINIAGAILIINKRG